MFCVMATCACCWLLFEFLICVGYAFVLIIYVFVCLLFVR